LNDCVPACAVFRSDSLGEDSSLGARLSRNFGIVAFKRQRMEIDSVTKDIAVPTEEAIDHFLIVNKALDRLESRGNCMGRVVYSRYNLEYEHDSLSESEDFTRSDSEQQEEPDAKKQKVTEDSFRERFSAALQALYLNKPFSCGGAILPKDAECKKLNLRVRSAKGAN
jgi:hypothetical protein